MKKIIVWCAITSTLSLVASKTPQFELRNNLHDSKNYKDFSVTLILVPPAADVSTKNQLRLTRDISIIKKMEDPIIIAAKDYEQVEKPVAGFIMMIGANKAWYIKINNKSDKTAYLVIHETKGQLSIAPQTSNYKICSITKSGLYLGNNIATANIDLVAKGDVEKGVRETTQSREIFDFIDLYRHVKMER